MIGNITNLNKRVLIYCGVHNGEGLAQESKNYDIIYGFDANIDKIKNAKTKFPSTLRKKFYFFNYALTNESNKEVEFNIFEKWDASSSLGNLNPEYGHFKTGVLKDTNIKKVKVKTINLGEFLKDNNINHIDRLVTDLQGNDLTVLKTLNYYIENKLIEEIKCEVEWDDKPSIYEGLQSNKLKDFKDFLGDNYSKIWHLQNSEDWWETDIEFRKKI